MSFFRGGRPGRGFGGFWVLGLAGIVLAGSFFPPARLLAWAARNRLNPPLEWARSGYSAMKPVFWGLSWPSRPAGLKAAQASLTHPIPAGVLSGAWSFDLKDIQIVPIDPKWPALRFETGRGTWRARERSLELRGWTSKLARFDADVRWGRSGRVESAAVRGDADASELRKALAGWKVLGADATKSRRLAFELSYQKGSLLITVDQKAFFRASWRGNVDF